MRRLAVVLFVLGLVAFGGAAAFALIGVDIEVAGRTYDCGAPVARLGGDDREAKWREYSFLLSNDPDAGDIAAEALPQVACKQKTDDRLTWVYVLGGAGVVLVLASLVLFIVGRRRVRPAPAPATTPPPPAA
jgi:hypothetical protein